MYIKQVRWFLVAYFLSNICTKITGIGQLLLNYRWWLGGILFCDTVYIKDRIRYRRNRWLLTVTRHNVVIVNGNHLFYSLLATILYRI